MEARAAEIGVIDCHSLLGEQILEKSEALWKEKSYVSVNNHLPKSKRGRRNLEERDNDDGVAETADV
ncbi:unnamed protein product [Taenia asiatica]|uniref:Ovule protein n=1 Tax=Taenia asiatica TaxID=60517 RepID=A0A0R3WH27_TAEAS|nr:unnamed protein product [Taenia asiatica]